MIDPKPIYANEITLSEVCADFTPDSLRDLTNEMLDKISALIAGCTDADVVFEPEDPEADDPHAEDEAETHLPWTLGHLIVHVTASLEESSFLAAELARGIKLHGRSRYETPWQRVKTMDQVQARMVESRRICLATVDVWPDKPILDVTVSWGSREERLNAVSYFARGLLHSASHLDQIADVVAQAKAARL